MTPAKLDLTIPSWTTFQELRPLARVSVKASNHANSHTILINSLGVRGEEAVVPKPPDVFRILCLGDESLLGLKIPHEALFTSQMQSLMQERTRLTVEVWNAGVPGACPLTEYLLLKHRLGALQPDLVVATVEEQDLAEDHFYRRFTRLDDGGIPLACRHPSLGRRPQSNPLTAWREQFRLVDFGLRWAGDTWKRKTNELNGLEVDNLPDIARLRTDTAAIERTLQPLVALAQWCKSSSAQLFVIESVSSDATANPQGNMLSTSLQSLSEAEQFSLLRVQRLQLNGAAKRLVWNSDEHREFANLAAAHMIETIHGPWSSPYFQQEPAVSPASLESTLNSGPTRRRLTAPIRFP